MSSFGIMIVGCGVGINKRKYILKIMRVVLISAATDNGVMLVGNYKESSQKNTQQRPKIRT